MIFSATKSRSNARSGALFIDCMFNICRVVILLVFVLCSCLCPCVCVFVLLLLFLLRVALLALLLPYCRIAHSAVIGTPAAAANMCQNDSIPKQLFWDAVKWRQKGVNMVTQRRQKTHAPCRWNIKVVIIVRTIVKLGRVCGYTYSMPSLERAILIAATR